MRLSSVVLPVFLSFLFCSCSLYRSPGRKDFESVFASGAMSTSLKNLKLLKCSAQSLRPSSAKLNSSTSLENGSVAYLWQFSIESKLYYELDNNAGTCCLYEEK